MVTGGLCLLFMSISTLLFALYGNTIENVFFRLLVIGGCLGVLSHLVLDAFTTAGIHIWPGFKFRLVPKTKTFATGTPWEDGIFKLIMVINTLLAIDLVLGLFGYDIPSLVIKVFNLF